MTPEGAPAQKDDRALWLDVAKGIGILLVVFGHACGGLIDGKLDDPHGFIRTAFLVIYIFHMPVFFMLAGMTVRHRVQRDPRAFGSNILLRIVYPYYVWSAVQLFVIVAAGNLVNSPYTGSPLHQLITLPWNPLSQFWFLQTLVLLQAFSLVFLTRISPIFFLLATFALKSSNELIALPGIFSHFCVMSPYFAIGAFLGISGTEAGLIKKVRATQFAVLVAAAGCLVWLSYNSIISISGDEFSSVTASTIAALCWRWPSFGAALICSVVLIVISGWLGRSKLLKYLGQNSFSIYVLHVMFIAGTRIVIVRIFGVTNPFVILPVTIMSGLIGSLVVHEIMLRLKIARLLGLP